MNKGVVIFAHNNKKIDYALLSIISGGLAKKHLGVPVSLITDESTVNWLKKSNRYNKAEQIFDQIILTKRPDSENKRVLYDGEHKDTVPFNNGNRDTVWDLTPYERTLLIDCDYFVLSNSLSEYWDIDSDFLIADSIVDPVGEKRIGYLDKFVSETSVKMFWATTVMFTKNEKTKAFFNLIEMIRSNYKMFGDVYRFNTAQYRNDISFSIARHIFDGFQELKVYNLPKILTFSDKDVLADIGPLNNLILLTSETRGGTYFPISIAGQDIHIINKQSIIRNADKLLELI